MNTLPQIQPEAQSGVPPSQGCVDLHNSRSGAQHPDGAVSRVGQKGERSRVLGDQTIVASPLPSDGNGHLIYGNLCPLCRQSMRLWALSWRAGDHRRAGCDAGLLIGTAAYFRNQCCHTDREKYDALVAKLKSLAMKSSRLSLAIWLEIGRIKNLHCGKPPTGRTFLAWQVDCATATVTGRAA